MVGDCVSYKWWNQQHFNIICHWTMQSKPAIIVKLSTPHSYTLTHTPDDNDYGAPLHRHFWILLGRIDYFRISTNFALQTPLATPKAILRPRCETWLSLLDHFSAALLGKHIFLLRPAAAAEMALGRFQNWTFPHLPHAEATKFTRHVARNGQGHPLSTVSLGRQPVGGQKSAAI